MKSLKEICAILVEKPKFGTSLMSSQRVPLPRKPAGQGPHSQDPSGELLQSTPPKHGLDRQPSARDLQDKNGSKQGKLILTSLDMNRMVCLQKIKLEFVIALISVRTLQFLGDLPTYQITEEYILSCCVEPCIHFWVHFPEPDAIEANSFK